MSRPFDFEISHLSDEDLWHLRHDIMQKLHWMDLEHADRPALMEQLWVVDDEMDYRDERDLWESDYDAYVEDSMTDVEADADTLASAGWGTDEDYGYYGDDYCDGEW